MKKVQKHLLDKGILIAYNPEYADLGPSGDIRIALSASHTKDMMVQLLRDLQLR